MMKQLLILLTLLIGLSPSAFAQTQSKLPKCKVSSNSKEEEQMWNSNSRPIKWNNCFGTRVFGNGDKYSGEFKDGDFNGQGTSTTSLGQKYVGEWKEHKKNGQGTYTFQNKFKYVGEFKDNDFQGKGTLTHANGNKYVGEWKDGKRNGQGTETYPNGYKYAGEYKDDKYNGQGTETYIDGSKYVGGFKDGEVSGQGEFISADGSVLKGIWADGKFVRAEKVNVHPVNQQTDVAINEERRRLDADRQALEIERHAIAQSQLPLCAGKDARRWTNCQGVHNFVNGDRYEGEFRDGKFNGWGTYYHLANDQYRGDKYTGQFLNGLRQGSGRYISASSGDTLEGIWNAGAFVRAEKVAIPASTDLALLEERKKLEEEKIRLADERRQMEEERKRRETAKTNVKMELSITATEPDSNGLIFLSIQTGVDTSSLKINGDEQGGNERGVYQVKRLPKVGQDTTYSIVAVDGYGNLAQKSVVVKGQAVVSTKNVATLNPETLKKVAPRDAVAIIVGIADYKKLPRADFANDDARSFYDYANRALGIQPENIKMLIDGEAEQVEILSAFRSWLPSYVKKDKTDVYVFYSGHGLPSTDGKSLFFLPQSAHKDYLPETGIDQNSLVAALVAAKPKSVTLFIDSCYSGSARSGETLLASARPIALKAKESVFPSNFTVISASRMDQISSSSPELKHGIFSFYVMKGMEGEADLNKDGKITVGELQSYLEDAVPRQAMKMGRKQEPQLVGDSERVLVAR